MPRALGCPEAVSGIQSSSLHGLLFPATCFSVSLLAPGDLVMMLPDLQPVFWPCPCAQSQELPGPPPSSTSQVGPHLLAVLRPGPPTPF